MILKHISDVQICEDNFKREIEMDKVEADICLRNNFL